MTAAGERTETLDTWFRRSARRDPSATALEVGGETISYARLDDLAGRLAAALTGAAAGAVGLYCSRSVAAYAGYLASLRAGATVVPLNPAFPAARNAAFCGEAGVDVILVDEGSADGADALTRSSTATAVRLPENWWRSRMPAGPAGGSPPARDVAYVLFTSGSTGRPKGVPIRHGQLADYLPYCARRYEVSPGCRLSQAFDLTFDPSVFDIFVAFYGGATVVVPQADELLTPAAFVAGRRITHWFSVPSVIALAHRLRGLRPGSMPELRWSLFAGEQLTLDHARLWAAAAPAATIENLYGPTELTITCTAYRLPTDAGEWPRTPNGTVPIGRPYPHLQTVVLDDTGSAAEEGELCVRGSQRFAGYLRPADDAGRFARIVDGVAAPVSGSPTERDWYRTGDRVRWQDGELVHLGRMDEQIKINGFRVEPGEIESVLRTHPAVAEAVVVAVAGPGGMALHAAYTGAAGSERDVLEYARGRLPGYLVPARIRNVAAFPLTSSGKTDRRAVRRLMQEPA